MTAPGQSVADGRALAARLDAPDADTVSWLCDRVQELEVALGANLGQVEGVCAVCGAPGWYLARGPGELSASGGAVVGLLGGTLARMLVGQAVLFAHGDVLLCGACRRSPT